MKTNIKPATALPWHIESYNGGKNQDIQSADGKGALTKENAAYIVHACNNFPRLEAERAELVAALRNAALTFDIAKPEGMRKYVESMRALLRKLGEVA